MQQETLEANPLQARKMPQNVAFGPAEASVPGELQPPLELIAHCTIWVPPGVSFATRRRMLNKQTGGVFVGPDARVGDNAKPNVGLTWVPNPNSACIRSARANTVIMQAAQLAQDPAAPQRSECLLSRDVEVLNPMLLADLARQQADPVVAMVPDAREEVMLDLRRETEGHVVPKVRVRGEVAALRDLHLRPGFVLLRVREQDGMGDLRAGHEDEARGEPEADVAEQWGPEVEVHEEPDRDLRHELADAPIHAVAADVAEDQQVQELLRADFEYAPAATTGMLKTLNHPGNMSAIQMYCTSTSSSWFVVRVVADDVPVVPRHRRPSGEVAQEQGQAVDPLLVAELVMPALVRQARARRGHDAAGCGAREGRLHEEHEVHHQAPHRGKDENRAKRILVSLLPLGYASRTLALISSAPHRGKDENRAQAHLGLLVAARIRLADLSLDLLVEWIWCRRLRPKGLQDLAVAVVPRVVGLEESRAIAASARKDRQLAAGVLGHELVEVIWLAVDVPQVGVALVLWHNGEHCLLGRGSRVRGRTPARGIRGL
eukprot:CAMPEP_0183600760 /NCGR_PEP_ID=MMETSP0371-20130417/180099_1 /TAXON_ID=268820 /ORGANISM="Peridinium aciculiferum, Strain PAER-2" /LENGTH=545 /DNA_ID=CAMNT_0025812841 /DNA_START=234 /DNA_END=1871 /DNA_ORIENTATION=+